MAEGNRMEGQSRGQQVLAINLAFFILAVITVGLRLVTRFRVVHNAGRDDACIVASVFFSLGLLVTVIYQVKNGMGRHQDSLTDAEGVNQLKGLWASIWLYNLSLTFTKISIIMQYLRIFIGTKFRIACWVMFGVVVVYSFWTFFSSIFSCTPVAYFWDKNVAGGHCLDQYVVWFVNAGINIATDFLTMLLPMPVLKNLMLPKRQKIALMLVFALAGFVCIVSILRLRSLFIISNSDDVSWDNTAAASWSGIEVNVGIICASLPTLKACVSRIFPRFFSTNSGTASASGPNGLGNSSFPLNSRSRKGSKGILSGLSGLRDGDKDRDRERAMMQSHMSRTDEEEWAGDVGMQNYRAAQGYGPKSHIQSQVRPPLKKGHGSFESADGDVLGRGGSPEGHINVVTVVEQEFEKNVDAGPRKGSQESEAYLWTSDSHERLRS
ncbi:hypothetical protein M8818_006592 [Zalaria obscura]|uniref:Uncharacterized protein n=1 Tax=Zalaria obscura TaxID=2024903 RepID=A0ACC3S677_9PEZI